MSNQDFFSYLESLGDENMDDEKEEAANNNDSNGNNNNNEKVVAKSETETKIAEKTASESGLKKQKPMSIRSKGSKKPESIPSESGTIDSEIRAEIHARELAAEVDNFNWKHHRGKEKTFFFMFFFTPDPTFVMVILAEKKSFNIRFS